MKHDTVYESDASQEKGKATKIFFPETLFDVSVFVKKNSNITIRGGGTGLAGGAVPQNDAVLDLSKMHKILSFNKTHKTIEVEAGIILDELNDTISSYGLEFPVQPSSHEVCTIGGMIATDAVGSRAVKFGRTSRWVDWIEIIDSNGEIRRVGKTELSEFAGLEGTTGIIVRAGLRLNEKIKRTASLFSVESITDVIQTVKELKRNQDISMIEFFDRNVSGLIGLERKYHLLVEYESDAGKFKDNYYEEILSLRDKVYPLLAQRGFSRIEDPKIFIEKFDELMMWFESNKVPVFGHLSVGILHPCFSKEKEKLIPELMKLVKKFSGSISGEHGIGIIKKQFLEDADRKLFLRVKKRNDASNKFNRGKIADL